MAATVQYKLKAYGDFSGGWNADSAPDLLADNECEIFDNIDTSISGALKQRGGTVPLNDSAYDDEVSLIFEWHRKTGATIYLGMIGNSLVTFNPETWEPTVLRELDSPSIGYMFFNDEFYFAGEDGGYGFFKIGGIAQVETAVFSGKANQVGEIGLTVSSTLINASGASPTYWISASGQNASTLAASFRSALQSSSSKRIKDHYVIGGTGDKITLTAKIPTNNDDNLEMEITLSDGASGVSLDSQNTTPGADLTVTTVTPNSSPTNDLNPIKRCKYFVWNPVNFRCFATGDFLDAQAIYYSEPNDPTFFKATSKLYPTRGEGPCKGLANFSTGVVCAYENTLWTFTGVDPAADATWKSLPLVHGALNQGSICATPNSLTMLGIGGLYALSPGALDKDLMMINASQLSTNLAINKVSSVLNSALHISTMVSCYDNTKQRYLLAYGDDLDSLKNNRILVFDFARNCFSRFTGIQANYFCVTSDGRVIIASGKYLLQLDQGVNDVDIDKTHNNILAPNQADVEFSTSGFSAFSSATLTRDTGEHWHGSASLKVVTPNAVAGEGVYVDKNTGLAVGQAYAASVYVKGSGSVRIGLRERTGGVEATTYGEGITLTSEWQRLTVSHVVTDANNTLLRFMVRTLTQQSAMFYVDGLQVESGDTATDWFIGSRVTYKPIETHVRTKGWNQDTPFIVKKLKKTFVAAYQYPTSGTTIDLGLIGGYRSQVFEHIPSIVYQDSSLPDSFIWGGNWGNVWGWADLITREFRTRMKATRFAIDIKHNKLDEDMLIYGVALLYRTKKAKGVRYHGVADKNILS